MLCRITAGGPGFEALRRNEFTDKYAKLTFADPEVVCRNGPALVLSCAVADQLVVAAASLMTRTPSWCRAGRCGCGSRVLTGYTPTTPRSTAGPGR